MSMHHTTTTRKFAAALLALALLFTCVACGQGGDSNTTAPEGTLEELMAKLYENAADIESPMTMTMVVTDENAAYYLGSTDVPYTEALASDAAISSIPHSVVLVRLEEGADIEAAKTEIKQKVDPRKWICVGVETDEVVVDNLGNLVFLVMSPNAQGYHQAFLKLAESK